MTDTEKKTKTVTYKTLSGNGVVEITIESSDGEKIDFTFDAEGARRFGLTFVHAAYDAEKGE
jgi:hypothetical protein